MLIKTPIFTARPERIPCLVEIVGGADALFAVGQRSFRANDIEL